MAQHKLKHAYTREAWNGQIMAWSAFFDAENDLQRQVGNEEVIQ
jgi:hypothetical protein